MRIRKPLFIVFTFLFVVILPFLISYALGYDLMAIARGRFVRTGGVFVASTPPRARFSIDGKEQSRRTPLSVISLPTGVHSATIDLEGFRPWVRSVVVKPGEVTIVDDALLVPEKWQQRFIASSAFVDLYPQSVGPYLLFRRGARLRDLWLYDMHADTLAKAVITSPVTANATVSAFFAEPGSTSVLLEVRTDSARRVLRGKVQWPALRLEDVTRLFPAPLLDPQWSFQDPDTIYTTRQGRLYQVRLSPRTTRPYEARRIAGFTLEGRTIYALDLRQDLWKLDPSDGEWQRVGAFGSALASLPDQTHVTLEIAGSDMIVALASSGDLVAAWPGYSFRASEISGFEASASYDRVLAWQKSWIATARLRRPDSDGAANPQGGSAQNASGAAGAAGTAKAAVPKVRTEWIPSRGGTITQAWFVYGVTHLLYHAGDQVTLRAPSHDGQDFSYWVATVRDGTSAWYSGETGRLYYIDGPSGKPAWTQVVTQPQPLAGFIQEIRDLAGASGGQ